MKKALILVVILFLIPQLLMAYDDPGGMNLNGPTMLKAGQTEFKIQHRFYGKVNEKPIDTFFGMYTGANISLSLRHLLFSTLELNTSYMREGTEFELGTSYAVFIPAVMLRSQIDAQFFSYKQYNAEKKAEERISNVFALLLLQTDPIIKIITPTVNVGYDGDNKKIGAGVGLSVIALTDLGIIRKLVLLGEYYPTKLVDKRNCYDFGIRLETYGHNFDFIFGNNSNIGVRHLMIGVDKTIPKGLYFGFNIKRLLG
jgi:hypothetical protein